LSRLISKLNDYQNALIWLSQFERIILDLLISVILTDCVSPSLSLFLTHTHTHTHTHT